MDEVRGMILGIKPLLSIREVFLEVRQKESRKKIMMGNQGSSNPNEASALAVRGPNTPRDSNQQRKNGRPWCEHCRKPGHTKETCWKLHEKPADWKPRGGNQPAPESRGLVTTGEEQPESLLFSKEQVEMLKKLISQQNSAPETIGAGTVAQQGNFSMALSSHLQKNSPWIVDSGASDHMTGNSNLFHTFSPCSGNYMVQIADGSTSKVAGMGTIIVTKDLILKSVLLVPKLTYNLLSISKLTKDLRCITHFSSTHCEFQDLESGRTIGNAKECAGLYLLKGPSNSNEQALHANSVSLPVLSNLSSKENAIMLWHFRLGHPNFQYLKNCFLPYSIILILNFCNVKFVNFQNM